MKDVLAYLIAALQSIGVAVLLLCAAGNALLGDWGNAAVALGAAVLLFKA
jgi:hypothetical protein